MKKEQEEMASEKQGDTKESAAKFKLPVGDEPELWRQRQTVKKWITGYSNHIHISNPVWLCNCQTHLWSTVRGRRCGPFLVLGCWFESLPPVRSPGGSRWPLTLDFCTHRADLAGVSGSWLQPQGFSHSGNGLEDKKSDSLFFPLILCHSAF